MAAVSEKLSAFGIEIEVPDGWSGKIYHGVGGAVIMQVANLEIDPSDGDLALISAENMDSGGVIGVLVDYGPTDAGEGRYDNDLRLPLDPNDFWPSKLIQWVANQAGVQQFFTANGRACMLYMSASTQPSLLTAVGALSDVLETLAVGPIPDGFTYQQTREQQRRTSEQETSSGT